ncbi:MAG: hypothetical protein JWO22_1879 [Frankiales bacterium]|nr:hypothetical protein [Frankiales bacterium]
MKRWLAAALLVTVGWLASPGAVPVYDGIGTDEPYRYVGKDPAPTDARITVPVTDGASDNLVLTTGETGPQLRLDLASAALHATGTSLTIAAEPLAADGTPPRGTFDGNAYRVTASKGTTVATGGAPYVYLRAAVMTKPFPVVVHRLTPTDPWAEVDSQRGGNDIIAASFTALGDYAVVRLPGSKPINAGGLSTTRLIFIGGGVVLLVVITVVVLRRPREDDDL